MRLGEIRLFLWLFALAQGAQAVAASRENAFQYDECVSAASFEYWDQDAQLLYLRARWYDPRIGRFINADLFEGKQRDPRSLNRYAYGHSDPVHNVDPSGLMTMMDAMTDFTNSYNKGSDAKRAFDSFNKVRETLCKGTDFVLSPINNLHHMIPKFMGGKDGDPHLLDIPENIHHAFHKLLSYALVLDGFPAPSKGAPKFIDFMSKNAGSKDKSTKVLLNVAEYVDNVCSGVKGYDKIKPPIEKVLPVLDIFVF